ncbi:hypothetical protein ACEU3E_35620, partial [Paenibacillus oleatilyticus]
RTRALARRVGAEARTRRRAQRKGAEARTRTQARHAGAEAEAATAGSGSAETLSKSIFTSSEKPCKIKDSTRQGLHFPNKGGFLCTN